MGSMQQQIPKMEEDINTLTADPKERFPFPREVRLMCNLGFRCLQKAGKNVTSTLDFPSKTGYRSGDWGKEGVQINLICTFGYPEQPDLYPRFDLSPCFGEQIQSPGGPIWELFGVFLFSMFLDSSKIDVFMHLWRLFDILFIS